MEDLTSIIILAWNQINVTTLCIESILKYTNEPYELILVDNGSRDRTLEFFTTIPNATVIHNNQNVGYASGCNQGIRLARGKRILLLNNDTVVSHNWLVNMVQCLESKEEIGIVTCYSNYVGSENQLNIDYKTIGEFHEFAQRFNQPDSRRWIQVSDTWISGFCMLIKKEVLDKIGLLDEQFEYGNHEDVDLCFRTTKAGYKLYIAGDAFIHHFGNQTFIANNLPYVDILKQNKILFDKKWGK